MFPPLPQAPGPVPAIPGPQGHLINPPVGGIPGEQTGGQIAGQIGVGLAQGLQSFLQNYLGRQRDERQEAAKRVEAGIAMASAGIPIDTQQIARDIKKSKLPISLEDDSGIQNAQQMQQQLLQTMSGLQQAQPPESPYMAHPAGAPRYAAPPLGGVADFLQQNAQAMSPTYTTGGVQHTIPSTAPNYNGPSWLQRLTAAGQLQQQSQLFSMENAQKMQGLIKQAIAGDPSATEVLTRSGIWKAIGPRDELFLLANRIFPGNPEQATAAVGKLLLFHEAGGPQLQVKMMDMAKDMAPYFGNDLQRSGAYVNAILNGQRPTETPGFSFDQSKEMSLMQSRANKIWPTAPGNLLHLLSIAQATGRQDMVQAAYSALQSFPTAEQLTQDRWQKDYTLKRDQHADQMAIDQQRIKQAWSIHQDDMQMRVLDAMRSGAQQEFDNWWKLYAEQGAPQKQKNEAAVAMVDALKRKGEIVINYNGKQIPLGTSDLTTKDIGWFTKQLVPSVNKPDTSKFAGGGQPEGFWRTGIRGAAELQSEFTMSLMQRLMGLSVPATSKVMQFMQDQRQLWTPENLAAAYDQVFKDLKKTGYTYRQLLGLPGTEEGTEAGMPK